MRLGDLASKGLQTVQGFTGLNWRSVESSSTEEAVWEKRIGTRRVSERELEDVAAHENA